MIELIGIESDENHKNRYYEFRIDGTIVNFKGKDEEQMYKLVDTLYTEYKKLETANEKLKEELYKKILGDKEKRGE